MARSVNNETLPGFNGIALPLTFRAMTELHSPVPSKCLTEMLDWLNALQDFDKRPSPTNDLEDPAKPRSYPEILLKLRDDWKHAAAK